jgi:hypothetical protein
MVQKLNSVGFAGLDRLQRSRLHGWCVIKFFRPRYRGSPSASFWTARDRDIRRKMIVDARLPDAESVRHILIAERT